MPFCHEKIALNLGLKRKQHDQERQRDCLKIDPYRGNKSSAVAEMGDRRLATIIDIGRKAGRGAAVPLSVGELGSHLTQCGQGRRLPPYQVTS